MVFALTISFYIYTLLPSLAWGDGTKLQSEAISGESFVLAEMPSEKFTPDSFVYSKVGVAAWDHPLYIIAGNLFVKTFSFIDSLWLINFFSAIFGAASVALVFLLSYQFTKSLLASGYASFSLAVSHTYWWHSTTPEVYTLFILLLLVSYYFFDKFERTGRFSFLSYSALFIGLAASTHLLSFLAIPALALYFFVSKSYRNFQISELKKLVIPALCFIAGFSIYIIQFIRLSRNVPLNEIMGPVVGTTFLSQLWPISPLLLGESLISYLFFLTIQFGPVGLILGAFGLRNVFDSKHQALQKILSFFIVYALFGIFYRVTDQFTFFITSYVFWVMLIGIGSIYALDLIPQKWRFLLSGILGLLLLATPFFYNTLPSLAKRIGLNDTTLNIPKIGVGIRDGLAYYINPNKRDDTNAYDFGSQTLANLSPNSVLIVEWYTDTDEYFIFRYFTKINKIRPDIAVIGWADEDPFYFDSQLALDVIDKSLPEHPVYLASLSDRFYASSKLVEMYCIVPENNIYRLYQRGDNNLECLGKDSVTE